MAARKRAAKAPEPDLTVSAVVTVMVHEGGCAAIQIKVDCEGNAALVDAVKRANGKLQIAAAGLRRVVMGALSVEMDGPPTDLLALRKTAGRA